MNNCGISRWDDPKDINARLKNLTSQPIWEVDDEYYKDTILKYYDEKWRTAHIFMTRTAINTLISCRQADLRSSAATTM